MKLKLLAFAFILAFAITPFLAFGAYSAEASLSLSTPGTTVELPSDAVGGAFTAFTNISPEIPVEFDLANGD